MPVNYKKHVLPQIAGGNYKLNYQLISVEEAFSSLLEDVILVFSSSQILCQNSSEYAQFGDHNIHRLVNSPISLINLFNKNLHVCSAAGRIKILTLLSVALHSNNNDK